MGAVTTLTGLRIVVIDDELDSLHVLCFMLEQAGAQVLGFDDGHEALLRIEQGHLDVLLCDLFMPRMDGWTLIRRVRALMDPGARAVPAAALTAYPSEENIRLCFEAGFQSTAGKPTEPADLFRLVRSLLPA